MNSSPGQPSTSTTTYAGLQPYKGQPEENALDSDEDLLTLSPSTLTALTSFFDEEEAARDALLALSIQSHPEGSTELTSDTLCPKLSKHNCPETLHAGSHEITVETFKGAFKENWQLSQFWYSRDTAERLTRILKDVCMISDRVAFLCCPTGYVAFKESGATTKEVVLLEYDTRFSILAGTEFVPYDLEEPLSFARAETLRGSMDIIVVDPPFHSEVSQKKISSTIVHLLRPGGRLVVLTGLTLSPLIDTIYPSPLPQLHRRDLTIEHDGVGRLATPYGCWVGGGKESQNAKFGNILEENNESG